MLGTLGSALAAAVSEGQLPSSGRRTVVVLRAGPDCSGTGLAETGDVGAIDELAGTEGGVAPGVGLHGGAPQFLATAAGVWTEVAD